MASDPAIAENSIIIKNSQNKECCSNNDALNYDDPCRGSAGRSFSRLQGIKQDKDLLQSGVELSLLNLFLFEYHAACNFAVITGKRAKALAEVPHESLCPLGGREAERRAGDGPGRGPWPLSSRSAAFSYMSPSPREQCSHNSGFDGWADQWLRERIAIRAAAPDRLRMGELWAIRGIGQAKMSGPGSRPGGATKAPCWFLWLLACAPLRITGSMSSRRRMSGSWGSTPAGFKKKP